MIEEMTDVMTAAMTDAMTDETTATADDMMRNSVIEEAIGAKTFAVTTDVKETGVTISILIEEMIDRLISVTSAQTAEMTDMEIVEMREPPRTIAEMAIAVAEMIETEITADEMM